MAASSVALTWDLLPLPPFRFARPRDVGVTVYLGLAAGAERRLGCASAGLPRLSRLLSAARGTPGRQKGRQAGRRGAERPQPRATAY